MTRNAAFLFLAGILFSSGCMVRPYTSAPRDFQSPGGDFSVQLPHNWWQYNTSLDHQPLALAVVAQVNERREYLVDAIRITKDGFTLQQIAIGRISSGAELPHTRRKFTAAMLPQEAAEVMFDNFRSNGKIFRPTLETSEPVSLAGRPGFKLRYAYETRDELKIQAVYYGVLSGPWLYYLLYEAPAQFYFARDLAEFEGVRQSLRILAGP